MATFRSVVGMAIRSRKLTLASLMAAAASVVSEYARAARLVSLRWLESAPAITCELADP